MKKYALLALLLCLALCLPGLAAAEDAKLMLDIVWVVDCTGSMPENINNIKDQLAKFASKLTDFDVQYGLVVFGDETNRGSRESTVKIQWDGSDWTGAISVLQKSMASGGLPQYFGGDNAETPTCGLYMAATEYAWRENAVHAIVLVADNDYKTQGTSVVTGKAIPSMEECLDACSEKNISINLLNCGTTTAYDNAVTQSGGVAGRTSDGVSTAVEQLAHGIHNTPVVITQPEDLYLHDDDIVYLTAETVKGRDTWFSWYYVNQYGYPQGLIGYVPTSDGIAQYRLRADSYMDGREYYCVFSNSNRPTTGDTRSIKTRHAILHVASKFAITEQPQDVTVEAGQTATFTVVATGDDLTYQWQKKSGDTWFDLSGETAATLSIPANLTDDGSEYRCVIKDAISDKQPSGYTLTSDSAALTVVAAPAITTDPKDVTTEDGKTATFTVQATGDGITYQWQKQSGSIWDDLPGETGASLTVPASLEISGSVYRCQVTSSFGTEITSDAATLTVLAKIELPQTGDSFQPWLWAVLLGASLLGLTMLRRRRA